MQILVSLIPNPVEVIPIWAAFTDAKRAVPGLEITLIGPKGINACICKHPAVTRHIDIDENAWMTSFWSPRFWRVRAELQRQLGDALKEESTTWIDPYGSPVSRATIRKRPGRRVGVSRPERPRLNRDYASVFPIPPELHPVQALRVLFAAELGYSLHDLEPDYGFQPQNDDASTDTDIVVDMRNLPWTDAEKMQFRTRLADTPLSIACLDYSNPDLDEATQLLGHWPLIEDARYLLTGINSTAWLAAALGRPGLCLCPTDQARSQGVISTHWARQKIINIDRTPFNEPHIVAESIVQVLNRHRQDP